uniref:Uncharacterized protein n=1 Tax=Physcomitrium patens TaxID=3218 RepID=A0A2K1KD52_PHYPA|nr:hypothetical protein PHYPA_010889 [Physcomitrium patens]
MRMHGNTFPRRCCKPLSRWIRRVDHVDTYPQSSRENVCVDYKPSAFQHTHTHKPLNRLELSRCFGAQVVGFRQLSVGGWI